MSRRPLTPLLCLFILAGVTIAPTRSADAQTAAELRRENERLKSQVGDLQAELDAARARIAELERVIADLKRSGRTRGGQATPPPPPPKVTVDESDPSSSPRAMLAAVRREYEEVTKDLELDVNDHRQQTIYIRHLRGWVQKINRRKTPVVWHVLIHPARNAYGRPGHEVTPIDPVTAAPLGEPFLANMPKVLVRRFDEQIGRGVDTFVMKGLLVPKLTINENRPTKGPFDNPPFIGPFAEFNYAVEVRALNLPEEQAEEAKKRKEAKGA